MLQGVQLYPQIKNPFSRGASKREQGGPCGPFITDLWTHAVGLTVLRSCCAVLSHCEASLRLQIFFPIFSSNPALITEACLWIAEPLKSSERSVAALLKCSIRDKSGESTSVRWKDHLPGKVASAYQFEALLEKRDTLEQWRGRCWFLVISWHVFLNRSK